jgi:hypothetical protein
MMHLLPIVSAGLQVSSVVQAAVCQQKERGKEGRETEKERREITHEREKQEKTIIRIQ